MAFRKDKTGAAQTAANASAVLVSAFADQFGNFEEAVEAYNDLRAGIFKDLAEVVDADNAVFEAAEAAEPARASKSSGSSRGRKTGGSSNGKSSITLDDALSMKLKYGAFEDKTLKEVLDIEVDEADEEYGYGDGERDGRDYIAWLASDKNQNDFTRRRAALVAEAEGIEV